MSTPSTPDPTAPEAMEPGGMVPTEHGMVPGCPNTPPCPHARIAHDVEDENDPLPMCCVGGCRCGHDRSQLPDPTPTPDTAAGRVALFLDVYASLAGMDPEKIYSAGSQVSNHETVTLTVSDLRALLVSARSASGTPNPPGGREALVPDEAWQAVEDLYLAHRVELDDFARTAISVAFSAARSGAGTAALTEDPETVTRVAKAFNAVPATTGTGPLTSDDLVEMARAAIRAIHEGGVGGE